VRGSLETASVPERGACPSLPLSSLVRLVILTLVPARRPEAAEGIHLEIPFCHCNSRHHSLALARAPFDLPSDYIV